MNELRIRITNQWPTVVHKCAGSRTGFGVVRFRVCRDGEETYCAGCGYTFVYKKSALNPADAYQWGPTEHKHAAHR